MNENDFRILDLGCGKRKRSNAIGIDQNPRSDADIYHDLDKTPYPFPDNHFDEVYADNILEHLEDVIHVMNELHRIIKPNGILEITVPFYSHRNANTDPTHKHWFGVHSFDYFVKGTDLSNFRYSESHFNLRSIEFNKGLTNHRWIDRMMARFANSHKDFYENRLANLFPLTQLTFRFLVEK